MLVSELSLLCWGSLPYYFSVLPETWNRIDDDRDDDVDEYDDEVNDGDEEEQDNNHEND